MSKSDFSSIVHVGRLDNPECTVFEFLCMSFPKISRPIWQERIESGKVLYENGNSAGISDIAIPGTRILYYREIENEAIIPFAEKILYLDGHILVADKPHFLPVTPVGRFVNESLQNRLRKSTGIRDLVPVNRLDRETAGLVLFSVNKETRDSYYKLFRKREVCKSYKALSAVNPDVKDDSWIIRNRLVPGEPWFRMKISDKPGDNVNAVSEIKLVKRENGLAFFSLHPETGQKHQLRIHMASIGFPVLNDKFYPVLQPESDDDYSNPLKLLAEKLCFRDPVSKSLREFCTEQFIY